MLRLSIIPLALLLLLGGAMLWTRSAADPPADFVFINRGQNKTLDPNRISWMQDIRTADALWEGLYALDPATLEPVEGAAERVEVSSDKTIYTFHLRSDGRWSNGDPVMAQDFVFAWRRMLQEPGDYTYLLHYIKGAEEFEKSYAASGTGDFSKVGIEVLEPRGLRVTLKHPVGFFPDLCAFPPFFPLNEKSMEPFKQKDAVSGRVTYDQKFTRPPHLVTNGPYRMAAWEFKRRIRLVASEFYWDREHVKSKTIEQVEASDPLAAFLKYDTGAVSWISEVAPDVAPDLLAKGRKDLKVFPGFGTYFYSINCKPTLPDGSRNPFNDVRVRQAFAMSFDKTPIVKNVTRMGEPVTSNYIPVGVFPGYASPKGLEFNPEAARKLLADAGFPGGKGFPRLSLLFNTQAHHADVAQIVRRQWQNNLGVDLELEGVEVKIFGERLHNKDYSIARASWIGDYNDPSTFTDKYLSVSENNDSAWNNAAYDNLCAEAAVETDPVKRLALFAQAEKMLCDDAPIIPIYHYVNTYLFRDNVRGIPLHPRNMVNFKSIEVVH